MMQSMSRVLETRRLLSEDMYHPAHVTRSLIQVAKHCLESCLPARGALPGCNDDFNGFERRQPYSQIFDHRR